MGEYAMFTVRASFSHFTHMNKSDQGSRDRVSQFSETQRRFVQDREGGKNLEALLLCRGECERDRVCEGLASNYERLLNVLRYWLSYDNTTNLHRRAEPCLWNVGRASTFQSTA